MKVLHLTYPSGKERSLQIGSAYTVKPAYKHRPQTDAASRDLSARDAASVNPTDGIEQDLELTQGGLLVAIALDFFIIEQILNAMTQDHRRWKLIKNALPVF